MREISASLYGKLLQIDVLRLDGGGEEERCGLREAVRIFCGQVVAGANRRARRTRGGRGRF